jgi:hypothetical protein
MPQVRPCRPDPDSLRLGALWDSFVEGERGIALRPGIEPGRPTRTSPVRLVDPATLSAKRIVCSLRTLCNAPKVFFTVLRFGEQTDI